MGEQLAQFDELRREVADELLRVLTDQELGAACEVPTPNASHHYPKKALTPS